MLDMNEINEEIVRLENVEDMTMGTCEKLSVLYTVRNNQPSMARSSKCEIVSALQENKSDDIMKILEEHFEAVRVLYPKEYDLVLQRIRACI